MGGGLLRSGMRGKPETRVALTGKLGSCHPPSVARSSLLDNAEYYQGINMVLNKYTCFLNVTTI